jgi:hypothetical protein
MKKTTRRLSGKQCKRRLTSADSPEVAQKIHESVLRMMKKNYNLLKRLETK